MNEDMGFESVRRRVPSAAIFVAALLLMAQLGIAQRPNSERLSDPDDLKTSLRGHLQRRLAAAYPDSFREGVDVLWEPRDGWVSEEVFSWWLSRLPEEDRGSVTQEAAERMFSRLSEQYPVFFSARKRALCAVVGPSRNLLESGYGKLIDAHDVVIRINRAPTEDYDSDVGMKTTHHLMWPRHLDEGQYDRQAFLLMTPVATATTDVFSRILELASGFEWDLTRVRLIHPEFVKYLHEHWTGDRKHYPSTGFIALMMALNVCDEVDVFGFGADALGRWDRYYEDDAVDMSGFHPGDFEGRLRREMESTGILKVFSGSRDEASWDSRVSEEVR
jgi:beta-galactoside alpha-2,3-sialyltransferase (sialyltransferase 4A)